LISENAQYLLLCRRFLIQRSASDNTRDEHNNGPTCTGDKSSHFTVRLPPYFRTRASKMCIKVAPVLQREVMPRSYNDAEMAEADLKLIRKKPARL
jgi:hypothetical protein